MLRKTVIPIIICGALMGLSGCGNEGDGPDIESERFNTDMITVYADGYYGLERSTPVEIKDPVYIEKIIEEASKTGEYFYVDSPTEGLNTVWIDFNNGTIISMRAGENYGSISETFLIHGEKKAEDLIIPERLPVVVEEAVFACRGRR